MSAPSNALENKALSLGKLLVPKGYQRPQACQHADVDRKRHGGRCKTCKYDVYETVTEVRWMTVSEQRAFRLAGKGIHLPVRQL